MLYIFIQRSFNTRVTYLIQDGSAPLSGPTSPVVGAEPEALGCAGKSLDMWGKKGVLRDCGWVCAQPVLLFIGFVVPVLSVGLAIGGMTATPRPYSFPSYVMVERNVAEYLCSCFTTHDE